jgi:hypothetical protein
MKVIDYSTTEQDSCCITVYIIPKCNYITIPMANLATVNDVLKLLTVLRVGTAQSSVED